MSPKSSHSGTTDKFSQLCVYCNKTFKTKGELEKHMKSHVTPSNQKCNICDEIFPSASILAEHKLTHCKVVKGNVCVVCKVSETCVGVCIVIVPWEHVYLFYSRNYAVTIKPCINVMLFDVSISSWLLSYLPLELYGCYIMTITKMF